MARALNRGRQTHLEVPSSNEPSTGEWGKPLWYTLRLAALQARETLTAEEAGRLASFFDSLHILIPCAICRGHYADYHAKTPYTEETATSTLKSMEWVEDLRLAVDARIKLEKQAAEGGSAPRAVESEPPDAPVAAPAAAVGSRGVNRVSPRIAPRSRHGNASASQRKYAIQSAVHISQMNHTGRKIGCNCGSNKLRK